jgi:hypothetical protein
MGNFHPGCLSLAWRDKKESSLRQQPQELNMNAPMSFLLILCMVGIVALAFAQNADTSVVRMLEDIVYKALP